jgi:hypothetical protein
MSQNSRDQGFSYYFCLMIEGSGSRRPKNMWIRSGGSGSLNHTAYVAKWILRSGFKFNKRNYYHKKIWERREQTGCLDQLGMTIKSGKTKHNIYGVLDVRFRTKVMEANSRLSTTFLCISNQYICTNVIPYFTYFSKRCGTHLWMRCPLLVDEIQPSNLDEMYR